MNEFQAAIKEIFKDKNFLETCLINGEVVTCICTGIGDGTTYGDAGLVSDVNFAVSVKLPIARMPKKGDILVFRDTKYKIEHVDIDSANTSITIFLESTSKGA